MSEPATVPGAAEPGRRARRRRRHHRHLPAVPRPRSRVLRAAARGRRRRRRHLVLEPLPRRPVRLRELHLRLPVLEGAVRRVGVAGALRRTSRRPSATSTTWSTGSTSGAHMRFGARVTSARVRRAVGHVDRARPRRHASSGPGSSIAATGVLSVPYFPDVPGRERLPRRAAPHRALAGDAGRLRRQARRGHRHRRRAACRSSPPSPTRSRRSPCTSAPPTGARRSTTRRSPPTSRRSSAPTSRRMREVLNTSIQRVPPPAERPRAPSTTRRRSGGRSSRRCGTARASSKLTSNYTDLLFDPDGERGVVRVHRRARSAASSTIPRPRSKLIPKDHRFGEKRPPFVTGYFEAFNNPNVSLVDLRETPIVRMTETGIETTDGVREFDIIVWATGFDFGTGALTRMGIRGRDGLALEDHWADGPTTFLGVQTTRLPELLLPRRPARGGRQQPALQRRPGRLRHRHARLQRATTATTSSRWTRPRTKQVDRHDDRRGAADRRFSEEQLLLRRQHPRQARSPASPQPDRPRAAANR